MPLDRRDCHAERRGGCRSGGPRWLQIYVFRDREVSDDVIAQSLESGFSALVLTADLPVYGIRHREARLSSASENVPAIVATRARR